MSRRLNSFYYFWIEKKANGKVVNVLTCSIIRNKWEVFWKVHTRSRREAGKKGKNDK